VKIRSITAGAGTGKTTKITRIIRENIISGNCRPDGVIGTTFTTKAAGELVERIRQELLRIDRTDLAERLAESLLGTVDSVCARLLMRFAFEAGISPCIQIIGDADSKILWSAAIEDSCSLEEIQSIREVGDRLCQDERWVPLWKGQIAEIAEQARENLITPGRLGGMAAQSCTELFCYFPPSAKDCSELDALLYQTVTLAIDGIVGSKDSTKGTAKYLEFLRECERDLKDGRITWSQWAKLSKELPTKQCLGYAEPVCATAAYYDEHPRLRADIGRYVTLLFEIAGRVMGRYQELKEERGLLDFVDLEERTLALLQRPEVATIVSEEFDLLVVDEFQDTNPIQLALFLRLAQLVRHGAIWVGDVKQAIYGFRGSDPALMDAVIARTRGKSREILDTTYRARPELVQIFNELFIPAFQSELGLNRADIELRPGRARHTALPVPLKFWALGSGITNKSGTPKRLTDAEAADAFAKGVDQLLSASIKIEDRDSRNLRALQFRDIAVLCRTNQGVRMIAEALDRRGFPLSFGTAGLLLTPEAHLALACLRRMADPMDTLATAEIIALEVERLPEQWLEDRLQYLADHPKDSIGKEWGLEGSLRNAAVAALRELHKGINQMTVVEALDAAIEAGDVFATVSRWGPSETRSAQRRANLEMLRGLAYEYQRNCVTAHIPATVAGFVFWCQDLETNKLDQKAADERADAIHVMTAHGAKGLEWPVVICAELDYEFRTSLWDVTVVQDAEFDAEQPLANRRLRFWPWPFGKQQSGIALLTKVKHGPQGKAAHVAAAREELRLLYVGFTRTRDLLILVARTAERNSWLDLLKAPWLKPLTGNGGLIDGLLGSGKVPFRTRILRPPGQVVLPEPVPSYRWFPAAIPRTSKLPAIITPSKQPASTSAKVARTINFGNRLPITGTVEEEHLGNALHAILAAEFVNPNHAARPRMIERILQSHGLAQNLSVQDVGEMINRFSSTIQNLFAPTSILVETPFRQFNSHGQQTVGYIDLLLETGDGFVIIDHKSFMGRTTDWPEKALSYSGQLAAYRACRQDSPIKSTWIHFPAGGGMVEVGDA
jgi:ATP-dependent exoDNAse (exonuclease V) beta subunit